MSENLSDYQLGKAIVEQGLDELAAHHPLPAEVEEFWVNIATPELFEHVGRMLSPPEQTR